MPKTLPRNARPVRRPSLRAIADALVEQVESQIGREQHIEASMTFLLVGLSDIKTKKRKDTLDQNFETDHEVQKAIGKLWNYSGPKDYYVNKIVEISGNICTLKLILDLPDPDGWVMIAPNYRQVR